MVIAQRISSHRQPSLSRSRSVFGIEITVVKNIYTDIYMEKYTYIYVRSIYVYTYIYRVYELHWTFPSVDVLLILLRCFSLIWSRVWFHLSGIHLRLKCICATPYLKGGAVPAAAAGATKHHCSSAPESSKSRNHLAAFDSNLFSCRFVSDGGADVIPNLLCASAVTPPPPLPFSLYY